jgi:CheY-like chemotaxis protein/anti-sigma regulatory factor (Ser/Thr protein kinase)
LGDPIRLKQILTNLMANAVKFTDNGSIVISVQPVDARNNLLLEFRVRDTGIGMSKEQLEKIFQRFEQGESDTARKYGGTGLGLAISKNLVELQGGSISVESNPGEGTCFKVVMPFERSAEIPQQAPESTIVCFNKEYKVLIVDDNEVNRMLVEYMLTQWGLSFESAAGGREAIDKLQKDRFHLVLMDIQMPELDGYATSKIIKTELQVPITIIAMTAHVMPGEEEKCRNSGMDGYISKPLQESQLNRVLANHFKAEYEMKNDLPFQFIDPGFMSNKFYGNQEFITRILNQVTKQYPEELEVLKNALQAKNASAVAKAAHKMASTVSILHQSSGPMTLLQEIEHAAKHKPIDWECVDRLAEKLFSMTEYLMSEAIKMEQFKLYQPSLS